MKHRIIKVILFLTLFTAGTTLAQDAYERSIGVRGGPLGGVTYKHFLEFAGAIEGIVGYNFQNGMLTTVTGLYEHHFFLNYQANWYAGGGLTFGFNKDIARLNAEAIIGIEYVIERFPMSLSLDYKPAYNLFGNAFYFDEFALSVRYVIR